MSVSIIHTPQENNTNRYTITGGSIQEIIEFCIPRIRQRSQEYYKKEIFQDLSKDKKSWIDPHAGMGSSYIIELN